MSEVASMPYPPQGEIHICRERVLASGRVASRGVIDIETAHMQQVVHEVDPNGVAYVEMNTAGRLLLDKDQQGLIATSSLAGCTAIAGYAELSDGRTAQFVGHFAPRAEALIIQKEMFDPLRAIGSGKSILDRSPEYVIPTPYNLQNFYRWASEKGASRVNMFVGYGGKKEDFYRMFGLGNYILRTPAVAYTAYGKQASAAKRTLLLPYDDARGDHFLAAGRIHGDEGIFWDGVKLDFDIFSQE